MGLSLSGCTYNIYEQKDHPEMDMFTHLPRWLDFYKVQIGRDLKPEDHLFPFIGSNGLIDPTKGMKYEHFARMLKKFTMGANLTKNYTTHSFRCGGAQYRFVHAPFLHRWTLNHIHWWVGWAVGECVSIYVMMFQDLAYDD